jgi:hypothetical protein
VAETTVERLMRSGFRRTGNAMGLVYQCWRRICREINVFFFCQVQISHVLRFYPFVTYLLTLPRTCVRRPAVQISMHTNTFMGGARTVQST